MMLPNTLSGRCMSAIIPSSAPCKKSVTKFSEPDSHFINGSSLMQSESGLLRWLKVPSLYNAFQGAIGGNLLRRKLIENHVRPRAGDKVIDIGCGPAQALRWFPGVTYVGLDTNEAYITFAKRTYGNQGTFVVGNIDFVRNDPRFKDADIVLAI